MPEPEIPLTGGRITEGVVRRGKYICRPVCANGGFVHKVLCFLEEKGIAAAPRFHGIDDHGREILDFIEGEVPRDLGEFSDAQCCRAAELIHMFHEIFRMFPGCPAEMTVCHYDLSPCNFVFRDGMPVAVIDWDAAVFGDPLDDLAYAAWMWLDIGNDEQEYAFVKRRLDMMLDVYGTLGEGFGERLLRQMERVGNGVFPSAEQTAATREWTKAFLEKYPY